MFWRSEVCPPHHGWPRLSFVQRPPMCRHRQHLQHQTVKVLHKELPPTTGRTHKTKLNPSLRTMTSHDNLGNAQWAAKRGRKQKLNCATCHLFVNWVGVPSHGMFQDLTGPRSCGDKIFTSCSRIDSSWKMLNRRPTSSFFRFSTLWDQSAWTQAIGSCKAQGWGTILCESPWVTFSKHQNPWWNVRLRFPTYYSGK